MRCPVCGTLQSEVTHTVPSNRGASTQRTRRCFNGHRYKTLEVSLTLFAQVSSRVVENHERASMARAQRWTRDLKIVRLIREGKLKKTVALEFGVAGPTIVSILRKMGADDLIGKRKKDL